MIGPEFWIRAFPRRFRVARGEELLATLAENEGALDVRAAIDIVHAGWTERWRTRPPFRIWVAYRFAGRAMPVEYHPWMWDDLGGWVGWRSTMPAFLGVYMAQWLYLLAPTDPSSSIASMVVMRLAMVLMWLLSAPLMNKVNRKRATKYILRKHGYIGT